MTFNVDVEFEWNQQINTVAMLSLRLNGERL